TREWLFSTPSVYRSPGHARLGDVNTEGRRPAQEDTPVAKEAVMGRTKEAPRGRLAALQDMLTDGSRALVDQAQSLTAGVQRRLVEAGRGAGEQVTSLVSSVEEQLSDGLDGLLSGLALTLRRDMDRVRDRVRTLENRLADVPKEGLRELILP